MLGIVDEPMKAVVEAERLEIYHFYFTDGKRTTRIDIPGRDLEFACMRAAYFCGGYAVDYLAAHNAKVAIQRPVSKTTC
jgi:hypothetical protein